MGKQKCNIVWLKRDLRTQDHIPLKKVEESDLPTLVCYFFEPSLMKQPDHAPIHWQFIYESLLVMQDTIRKAGGDIYIFNCEVIEGLSALQQVYEVKNLYAHQETGIAFTFQRDIQVHHFCKTKGIQFLEFSQDGVRRKVKNRVGWQQHWSDFIASEQVKNRLENINFLSLGQAIKEKLKGSHNEKIISKHSLKLQPGGELMAHRYLDTFVKDRFQNYSRFISKPELSRKSCSRLSPYLAYGCLSVKQVYHKAVKFRTNSPKAYLFDNFQSRLWWRSHYIQKLETEYEIAERCINPAFELLQRDGKEEHEAAFYAGITGFPMVDASIRCLKATGFMNFRMRAMLSTFFSFTLWLDWRKLAVFLANIFLDYEPGIHYPQLQMQAGTTGYHPLRVYNPTVQSQRHDPDGIFVKKWIPELAHVPAPQVYEPWKMTHIEQGFYQCKIGEDYPRPIVDFDRATKANKDKYWSFRHSPEALKHLPAVWEKHCLPENITMYKKQFTAFEGNL